MVLAVLLACSGDPPVSTAFDSAGSSDSAAEDAVFTLEDVGVAAGVQDRMRRNRGACAADFDTDGDVDLYLANPADPATLLLNQGDGTFSEQPDAPTTLSLIHI